MGEKDRMREKIYRLIRPKYRLREKVEKALTDGCGVSGF